MPTYSLFHLSDQALASGLASAVTRDRAATATLLAHIAEFDARRLYAPAGYSSMHGYCMGVLRLSEGSAFKRIRAARLSRRFPQVLHLIADGRLHLSAVALLAARLTHENASELLSAATHKSRAEVEALLACRFPQKDAPARVLPLPQNGVLSSPAMPAAEGPLNTGGHASPATSAQLSPGTVEAPGSRGGADNVAPQVMHTGTAGTSTPDFLTPPASPPRIAPVAPARYCVQFTAGQATRDMIQRAENLLGHRLDSAEMDQIFGAGLATLITNLEKRRFSATSTPRQPRKPARGRHVPADVRRTVWARDGGQCTFVSDDGRRCDARKHLEFDHVEPVARGGRSTVGNLRLRCRAHNQMEADRVFGAGFMDGVRKGRRSDAMGLRRPAPGP